MSANTARLDDVTLSYAVSGSGDKPWLILSNSLGATRAMWAPQLEALTRRYQVLCYDTRGHGASDAPQGAYSFDMLVRDVIGLMDHLGIETARFMGLSMGGMTGLGLALNHPDRITHVVCADGRSDSNDMFRAMWDERMAKVNAGGLAAIVEGTLATWFTADWLAAHPDQAEEIRQMVLCHPPHGYIGCCLALKELDYLRHLPRVRIPVLYVGGDQDKGAPPEVMQAMADATPGGEYRIVKDAAHVANINAPEAYLGAIADFLEI